MADSTDFCFCQSSLTLSNSTPSRLGWYNPNNNRGTIDIIWSCLSTLLICVYAMLHLNLPDDGDGFWTIFARKARWMLGAIILPETLMLFAASQWESARQSVADMRALGYTEWSLTHAFYTESGGFMIVTIQGHSFPLTAKRLHYLVKQKIIPMPEISKEEIEDKSTADYFAKTIAGIQAIWFIIQCIGRVAERLPLTLLELATLAIVVTTASSLFFWLSKPLNVATPTIIKVNAPIDTVFTRLPNDGDIRITSFKLRLALFFASLLNIAIHMLGWNTSLPTKIDQYIWRSTCVIMAVWLGVSGVIEMVLQARENYSTIFDAYGMKWSGKLLLVTPGALYLAARLCLLGEIIASLRSLPVKCFVEVDWSNFIPHI